MKFHSGQIRLSASDLSNHLGCNYVTASDLRVARGERTAPDWRAPDAWVLQQRGMEHERAYLKHLEALGLHLADLSQFQTDGDAAAATWQAMQSGADVIAQATLASG